MLICKTLGYRKRKKGEGMEAKGGMGRGGKKRNKSYTKEVFIKHMEIFLGM